jgi:hypothetical protein
LSHRELANISTPAAVLESTEVGGSDTDVLTVSSLPALVQVFGYLKYKYSEGAVLLRGQTRLHESLDPSLYRPTVPTNAVKNRDKRDELIGEFIASTSPWKCAHELHKLIHCPEKLDQPKRSELAFVSAGTPRYSVEPLLQHYGIRTRWLDVVDNLWTALWFACHTFDTVGSFGHVVRRVPKDAGAEDGYTYLLIIVVPGQLREIFPGLYLSEEVARVIDLRKAVPSFYLRPHAQHGWLLRPLADDLGNLRSVVVRVPLESALEWLGQSLLLSPFGLFPPATVDIGYAKLLRASVAFGVPELLGSIVSYGPGY